MYRKQGWKNPYILAVGQIADCDLDRQFRMASGADAYEKGANAQTKDIIELLKTESHNHVTEVVNFIARINRILADGID